MCDPSSNRVTDLLEKVQRGDTAAQDALFERVYTVLRERARGERARWKGAPSLRTTALAHEAYLKLVDRGAQSWENRAHFMAVAARAMRHILIDRLRHHTADKRGGDEAPLSLEALRDALGREVVQTESTVEALLTLDAALERLADEHPRAARGVECRFFSGLTIQETAEALDVSTATVSRDWVQAKAWLYREMKRTRDGPSAPDES